MNPLDISRTVEAEFIGTGKLLNHRLGFTFYSSRRDGGVADIVKASGHFVEGVLLKVPDFNKLDTRENCPIVYKRRKIRVHTDNNYIYAYTYEVVNKSFREIKPSSHYENLIVEGARKYLSAEYNESLSVNLQKDRELVVIGNQLDNLYEFLF